MINAILIPTNPFQCLNIASEKQTIIVTKTKPKLKTPFKAYIYCTKNKWQHLVQMPDKSYRIYNGKEYGKYDKSLIFGGEANGKVIGEFVCDTIITDKTFGHNAKFNVAACMTDAEVAAYCVNNKMYGLHISHLEIYDCPKALSEFHTVDKDVVKKCEHREQSYHSFTDTGYIKNGFLCRDKCDWCTKCKVKILTKAPSSYCYVEELK